MKHIGSIFIKGAVGFLLLLVPISPVLAGSDGSRDSTQRSSGDLIRARSTSGVEFDAQRNLLRVTAQGQTMDQVLAAISDATKVHFHRYASDCDRVSVQFDFLPLDAALAQVLKGRNYVLSRAARQGTIEVWVLPASDADALTATEIMAQEFYKEFQGLPETERFAGELQRVERELSGLQAAGSIAQAPSGTIILSPLPGD